MNLFSFTGLKADDGTCMSGSLFLLVFEYFTIGNCSLIGERFVEYDNEIVLKIVRHATAIAGGITDNFILFGNNLDIRAFVEGIHYDIRMVIFRKSETEQNCTIGRTELCYYVMFCQINFIVVR